MRWVLLAWIAALTSAPAADREGPQLLARIRTRMTQTLARLPDYTCRETIERSVQKPGATRFENRDLLRVDVAYLNGRELYAWPGERFGEKSLLEMVPGGAIGTGNFGALGRAVFADNGPVFMYEGRSAQNGRNQVRYSFQVPLGRSNYAIHNGQRAAMVAYHGWFTADAETGDVIAFEVEANEIPRELETLQGIEHVEYARSHIGNSDYLLPGTSETVITDLKGEVSRNHITLERCREYAGESTVTFGEPGAVPAARPLPAPPPAFEARVELHLRITTPIDPGVTAIGDRIRAEVTREVRRPLIPVGSIATLRVIGMETVTVRAQSFSVIKFELLRVEAAGQVYDVKDASLQGVSGPGRYHAAREGRISLSGPPRIPAGLQMTWLIEP